MRRIAAPAAVVMTAALFASGCAGQPGAAAVVDGEAITESELTDAATTLEPFLQEGVAPAALLGAMIQAPVLVDVAAEQGIGFSADQAREQLTANAEAGGIEVPESFSPETMELARYLFLAGLVNQSPDAQAINEEVLARLAELDVEVSPRYGSWDPTLAQGSPVQPGQPEWIVAPAPEQA
ncbi:SurA N-terminal domain-containing protein [Ruania suaedae]|uniref:SurA N-terminal domain-containing protein n=1 Tax=Ruania suaedae TaxID=2897774 RepID=UPI001E36B975|nr:SurA N-terminal domain-containing protein [Ruania suaedae]UFU03822.1 SurA N-terminal domain-containing protein [Ruania suaedae]